MRSYEFNVGVELSEYWVYSPPVIGSLDANLCPMGDETIQNQPVWCGRPATTRYGVQQLKCCSGCANQLALLGY